MTDRQAIAYITRLIVRLPHYLLININIKIYDLFCQFGKSPYLCIRQNDIDILRDGAVVARWAHNPKVGGSSPPPATEIKRRVGIPTRRLSYQLFLGMGEHGGAFHINPELFGAGKYCTGKPGL